MPCARQNLGLPDNCALCEHIRPDLYEPCKMHPERVKPLKKDSMTTQSGTLCTRDLPKKLSYEEAKKQVMDYIQTKGGKVTISEIVEKLKLDIELVTKILEE